MRPSRPDSHSSRLISSSKINTFIRNNTAPRFNRSIDAVTITMIGSSERQRRHHQLRRHRDRPEDDPARDGLHGHRQLDANGLGGGTSVSTNGPPTATTLVKVTIANSAASVNPLLTVLENSGGPPSSNFEYGIGPGVLNGTPSPTVGRARTAPRSEGHVLEAVRCPLHLHRHRQRRARTQ